MRGWAKPKLPKFYHWMKPEDQRLFRQFKRFHKRYYETHGHDAPSHQLTRSIVQQMFPGLPSADADTIAKARAELLAAERLKELCKQLGLAVPTQPQAYPPPPEVPEYHRHLSHHDSCQDRTRRGWQLNNNLRQRLKKLRPSQTSNKEAGHLIFGSPGTAANDRVRQRGPHYYKGGARDRSNAGLCGERSLPVHRHRSRYRCIK